MSRGARSGWLVAVVSVAVTGFIQVTQVDPMVDVQLLAINDFHGGLDPVTGGNGRIAGVDAGGVEYLATHLERLKRTNPNTLVVAAGDNIGGTPLLSSLFHDEPSVEALGLAGLQISSLGNHELDEGWWELYRIQRGGCHPVDGCQDDTPFDGARYTYLAANVTLHPSRADPAMLKLAGIAGTEPRPLLPGYLVRDIGGVRIGIIGLVLQGTPVVTVPSAVRGLVFGPEAEAANAAARELRNQGVRAIVVLMHQGGDQRGNDINGCQDISSDLRDLVGRMSDDIDVVVSGHSHQAYNCTLDGKLVTSAASIGRVITDIDLRISRTDGDVAEKSARNLVVTQDVARHPAVSALLERYRPAADAVAHRVVGSITASLTRSTNAAGESTLGDVVADALLDAARKTPGANADLAIWNPGGIRADLEAARGAGPRPVTFADAFAVLPFGNELIVKTVTGATLLQMLENQFGAERTRVMQVSNGFTYAYDDTRPRGQRILRDTVRINGAPLDPARQYRLATSNFLWDSGDGLDALAQALPTDTVFVGTDHEIFAEYLTSHSPVRPGPQNRIRRIR